MGRSHGHCRGIHRHDPAFIAGIAQSPYHFEQIPRRQAHQRSRRRGSYGRIEQRVEMKKSHYLWLKNPQNLSPRQRTSWTTSLPHTSRPAAPIACASPSGALSPTGQRRRVPQTLVLVRHPQPSAGDDRSAARLVKRNWKRHNICAPDANRSRHRSRMPYRIPNLRFRAKSQASEILVPPYSCSIVSVERGPLARPVGSCFNY